MRVLSFVEFTDNQFAGRIDYKYENGKYFTFENFDIEPPEPVILLYVVTKYYKVW